MDPLTPSKSLENPNAENILFLSLKINTKKIKRIHSKDAKGNPNKYKMEIKTTLDIVLNNNPSSKKDFIDISKLNILSEKLTK